MAQAQTAMGRRAMIDPPLSASAAAQPRPNAPGSAIDPIDRVACNLCGSRSSRIVLRGPDRLHHLPGQFTLVRCVECGLVYQSPRPAEAAIGDLYPASYEPFQSTLDDGYIPKEIRRTAAFVDRFCPRGGDLLDVGCGAGDFLLAMRRLFPAWTVRGVEPNLIAVERAQQRNLAVIQGALQDVPHVPQPDVVTLWNVLEHVPDPLDLLQQIEQRLAPHGRLCLAVPVHDSWEARLFGAYWVGWELPRHLYAFDRVHIYQLLHAAGFTVRQQACISGTHHGVVRSCMLALEATTTSYAVRRFAEWLCFSQLVRVGLKPYIKAAQWARRGTVLTIAAQRTRERA